MSFRTPNNRKRLLEKLDTLDAPHLRNYLRNALNDQGYMEALFGDIFQTLKEGIIVVDNNLKIRLANPAARELFGIPENFETHSIAQYFRQFDWNQFRDTPPEQWDRFSRTELEVTYPKHRFLSLYFLPVTPHPDPSPRGSHPLATLIFHDITERKEDNEKSIETGKLTAITQLAAGVAHELGNPLNTLGIHLQILKRKLRGKESSTALEAAEHFTEIASQEMVRMDGIIRNFLHAVRPGRLERSPLHLQDLVLRALKLLQPEFQAKGIRVSMNFPAFVPVITGDAGQLTQAFFNLMKNAMQALESGGELQILCTVDDTSVHLRFADNGPGLSAEQLSHLLEPYYTTKEGGHGLGLLIVNRIVQSHGGVLSIDGKPGDGAAFTISLPRSARNIRQLSSPEA